MKDSNTRSIPVATNAASSGIELDRKTLKQLMKRTDRHGLMWLAGWLGLLLSSGYLLHVSFNTTWFVPMLFIYGGILSTSAYSLSHECAHGTAFRTRWPNEILFWISSFIYGEEHCFRRYSHASHHTYTYHNGLDAQTPSNKPLTFVSWLDAISGFGFFVADTVVFVRNATGKFAQITLDCTPQSELPKLMWSARIYLIIYFGFGLAIYFGAEFLLWYLVIPRLLGQPVMGYFVISQHLEMKENQMDIRESTRSFKTNPIIRFLYMNMNYHVEHHLYPTVPFHALPGLNRKIRNQIPKPDPGLFLTNWWGFKTAIQRSLGRVSCENLVRTVTVS